MSKLMGVVLDRNDARVTRAEIKILNYKFERELESDDEGNFSVVLPAGDYRITVRANGFREFVLPSFKVNRGVTEMINVHLEEGSSGPEPVVEPLTLTTPPAKLGDKVSPSKPW